MSWEQVTKRVDINEGEWSGWNWRTDGDLMVNGAFFVPSGAGLTAQYAKASSVEPKAAALIVQLTGGAGVLGAPRYTYIPPPTRSPSQLFFSEKIRFNHYNYFLKNLNLSTFQSFNN